MEGRVTLGQKALQQKFAKQRGRWNGERPGEGARSIKDRYQAHISGKQRGGGEGGEGAKKLQFLHWATTQFEIKGTGA